MNTTAIIVVLALFIAVIIGAALLIALIMVPWGTLLQAISSGVAVGPMDLIGMKLRGVDPEIIVKNLVRGGKSGILVNANNMEAHVLCSGDLDRVIEALIQAHQVGLDLDFDKACAIDLAGRDVLEAVNICIRPITDSFKATGIAKDGIQLHVKVKITLKADIQRLIGGMTERTIQARVIQGVISTIGSADKNQEILVNPSKITQNLLNANLDNGTAFKIISIDIEDIDVGKNIGAHLRQHSATADKQVAQAKAEGMRADAVAAEYEALARSKEMEARLIKNEMDIPLAMVEAYSKGRLVVQRPKKYPIKVEFGR